jgi:hypothetical protein
MVQALRHTPASFVEASETGETCRLLRVGDHDLALRVTGPSSDVVEVAVESVPASSHLAGLVGRAGGWVLALNTDLTPF